MRSSKELRAAARESLSGNYGVVIGAYIIYTIIINTISAPLSLITGAGEIMGASLVGALVSLPVSVLISIISVVLNTGVNKICYDVVNGERADLTNIFYCLTHNPLTVICTYFWILLYILPGAVVLLVGTGIFMGLTMFSESTAAFAAGVAAFSIAALFYVIWIIIIALKVSMTYFLYYENPEMKAGDLVRTSIRMMRGHNLRLFKLYFSYIGYYLLGLLSCGLALLWVSPNFTAATALFYADLRSGSVPPVSEEPEKSTVYTEAPAYYGQEYWN
ncbi:MAG: DUF975 family protein [Lachnospiraceae bacterium]|nr:DUF975 family protein [Lachnospiraceae bacterium]